MVTPCATIQSARLRVRTIHQLYATPAINPTSQYGPCSEANNSATSQNETGVYCPSGTFSNCGRIIQRMSQPRQKSSSRMGTATTLMRMRKVRKTGSDLSAGGVLQAGEDTDVAHRLLVRGRKIVYAPGAVAYHKHWKDWPAQKRMERSYGIGAGAQFAKYVRAGDLWGLRFFCAWVWQLGVRRMGAGLLKWRNPKVVYLGYCQLLYPWIGLLRSSRYAIDRPHTVYVDG